MKIIPLSEGQFTVDKSKQFVPFNENEHNLQSRLAGSLLVEIQPFLLITSNDIILLDTGLGFSKNGKLQLHTNLAEAGIHPSDISKVLVSHLHKDHAGAIAYRDDHSQLCFPNATYYVQERELNFAIEKGFPSYTPDDFLALTNAPQVVLLREEEAMIDEFIHYKITAAHSPYHQVFWIQDKNEIIFFGGDDAPQLQHMKHRFVAKYDFNGRKAMELRKEWWEKGQTENWKFLFYHDIKTPIFSNDL